MSFVPKQSSSELRILDDSQLFLCEIGDICWGQHGLLYPPPILEPHSRPCSRPQSFSLSHLILPARALTILSTSARKHIGLCTVFALVGKFFPQTFPRFSPSLHSGLISNVTSSGWPLLTIQSKIAPTHSLKSYSALFFAIALTTTYHVINLFILLLVSLLERKIYESRDTNAHTFTAVSPESTTVCGRHRAALQ